MDFIQQMKWRYATKRMTGARVPSEKIQRILEAASLSPSSFGMQPYTILAIEDLELRKKLQPICYDQAQVVECSLLLIFCAWENTTISQVDEYMKRIASIRNVSPESLSGFKKSILEIITTNTPEQNLAWSIRQAYIALGVTISACAMEEVDATPMEGFKKDEMDLALNLKEKGLKSLAMCAIGYRDIEKDTLVTKPKVRRSLEDLYIWYR